MNREPFEILSGARRPRNVGITREERVRMVGEVAQALQDGRAPAAAAAAFVGAALASWLAQGGSLESRYLRVAMRGSHRTPQRIWADRGLIDDERQGITGGHTLAPSIPD